MVLDVNDCLQSKFQCRALWWIMLGMFVSRLVCSSVMRLCFVPWIHRLGFCAFTFLFEVMIWQCFDYCLCLSACLLGLVLAGLGHVMCDV